jgi:hypothetical protein
MQVLSLRAELRLHGGDLIDTVTSLRTAQEIPVGERCASDLQATAAGFVGLDVRTDRIAILAIR